MLDPTLATQQPTQQPTPPLPSAPEPPAPAPKAARMPNRARPTAQPSAARAGALLAQPEDAPANPSADEPVRFVTDPHGRGYGAGMVARGGTAEHAAQAVPPSEIPAPSRPMARLVFAARLSRQPGLGAVDPCRGFFPPNAHSSRGEVSVLATIRDQGTVARIDIESESPTKQGFGAAARACLTKQRFTPALDDAGTPTAARTRIRIRFSR